MMQKLSSCIGLLLFQQHLDFYFSSIDWEIQNLQIHRINFHPQWSGFFPIPFSIITTRYIIYMKHWRRLHFYFFLASWRHKCTTSFYWKNHWRRRTPRRNYYLAIIKHTTRFLGNGSSTYCKSRWFYYFNQGNLLRRIDNKTIRRQGIVYFLLSNTQFIKESKWSKIAVSFTCNFFQKIFSEWKPCTSNIVWIFFSC